MKNIKLTTLKKDYRTAIVLDDVQNHLISKLDITKPNGKKKDVIFERK